VRRAGFTPLAFANALRIGSSSPVYVAGFTPRERLDRGTPSPEITFNAFCELCLVRHGATVAERTRKTLSEL
jgi:hypothetical protein